MYLDIGMLPIPVLLCKHNHGKWALLVSRHTLVLTVQLMFNSDLSQRRAVRALANS